MPFFNAVRKGNTIGEGRASELVCWLETYVNVLFPQNGVEYWSDNSSSGPAGLKPADAVPGDGLDDDDVHHVACYVRQGSNEGWIVEVALALRDDRYLSLTWAKVLSREDECWQIARAVAAALNSLIIYGETPEIVDMAGRVPRQWSWSRISSLTDEVTIAAATDSILVTTDTGILLDARSWADKGAAAEHYVRAFATDWATVLTSAEVAHKVEWSQERRLILDDLPGYVISDRGLGGISGRYVLPPGGRRLVGDDYLGYLGYFATPEAAIAAARAHRDARTPSPV